MAEPSRTMYDQELITDLFSKVRGNSALAKLSQQQGIPFVGTKEFTFSMDNEVDIVAENGKKTNGGISFDPIKIVPIKFEYGARVSDEFLYASDEEKIKVLMAFNDGFAKKLAKGFDIAAFHGFNPRTSTASTVVGENHFDAKIDQKVDYAKEKVDENLDDAIALVDGSDGDVTGIAMSKVFGNDMSKIKENGVTVYPAFKFGGAPDSLNGMTIAANNTVSKGPTTYPDHAIVGDFQNAFKWGYSKEIPLQIIEYGDPDNTGKDLKGYGQVYIRAESYLGWGILVPEFFARIVTKGV